MLPAPLNMNQHPSIARLSYTLRPKGRRNRLGLSKTVVNASVKLLKRNENENNVNPFTDTTTTLSPPQ